VKESQPTSLVLWILSAVLVGAVLYFLRGIFRPFFVAIFLSVLLEPVVEGFTRWKIPKPVAVFIVMILAFAVLFLMGILVYASAMSFVEEYPRYEQRFLQVFRGTLALLHIPLEDFNRFLQEMDWTSAVQQLSIPSIVTRSVGSFFSFLGNIFLVLLFMLYSLMGKEYLYVRIRKAYAPERAGRILAAVTKINHQLQRYLVTKTLISLATGLLATVILLAFGVDFAILWGVITFLLNFIPNIGSIIATIPPILLAFLQFGGLGRPLLVALCLILLQMTMGNGIEPRVMGRSLDLSPLVVILSLIFWGFLWGIVGMILAVPITAAFKIVAANVEPLRPVSVLLSGVEKE
jgi:predicted PurR-regulated permease PerM